MQTAKAKAEALGRKAKLANSYQELLDEFASKDLRSVGNYTLGRLIGKGSFGKVYLATHKLTNGSKVVLKSANKNDSNLAREIHHHRQFVHPHIARLYEVIVTESMVWLVLEYCSGDELYNYLLEHGRLPVDKVQRTFTQLVGAVAYVHMQSCVHRDLKLENILLDKHENVKLVDFGFTREYEGKANHLQTFCGTICYSAPEMLKGEKYAGEKVDVWSLGIILYALLTGELPFDDDDDNVTRTRILSQDPKYPDFLPPDALSLLRSLLSKRPLLRLSLSDILAHPFLAEHAPQQQAILKIQQPPPFSTHLEKETLQRMRSAGVDIDTVIESVLAQRCDALAGWWTLLIEKEVKKARRRDRKRREKEAETRSNRRLSAASSRLERLAPTLHEVDEEGVAAGHFVRLGDPPLPRNRGRSERGRSERRSGHYPDFVVTDLPGLPEFSQVDGTLSPDREVPPPPIDKDSIRSASSSRHRPIPPPKEGVIRSARSRGSTLHLVTTSDYLNASNSGSQQETHQQKVRKKPSQAILAHWKNWTHWLVENTRRAKNANKRGSHSTPDLVKKPGSDKNSKAASPRPQTGKNAPLSSSPTPPTSNLPPGVVANGYGGKGGSALRNAETAHSPGSATATTPSHPLPRVQPSTKYKRQSLSPSPITPRSTMRRSSAGLRGRKSTSSSVSSVRSMHHSHHHTHSKASSTSSTNSVSTSMSKTARSPHHSVKVLPATPTSSSFPSSLRLVRGSGPMSGFNEGIPSGAHKNGGGGAQPPGSPNPFATSFAGGPSVLFAKRKKNIFKGPVLSFGGGANARGPGSGSHSRSQSASGLGRRSGEITIQEVDEDAVEDGEEDIEEDVEEVEAFSPVIRGPGEKIEEIYEEVNTRKEGAEEEARTTEAAAAAAAAAAPAAAPAATPAAPA